MNLTMGAIGPVSTDVVDVAAARRRLGGDERLFRTIVRFFFEDSPGLLAQLREGVEKQDAAAVRLASHRLNGLFSNFGAQDALAAAGRMEELAVAREWASLTQALADLEQEIERVVEALSPHH